MTPIDISVQSQSGPYPVRIDDGLAGSADAVITALGISSRLIVVSSPLVWRLHGSGFPASLAESKAILVPDGERYKQLSTVARIYDALLTAEVDRRSVVVAVGGGVIGDMAGFAAATYLRGLRLVHVPTTLLAQVDSSIGGKVGVNHPLGKNLIGAFHPPLAVIVDPLLVRTLPRRELRAGLYEVVKYGVIASRSLLDRVASDMQAIFSHEPSVVREIVVESCRIKGAIVSSDEHETGRRRILNFGHTAAHALEAITRYRRFRHGEAVAYGMMIAAEIAVERGMFTADEQQRLRETIIRMGPLPPVGDLSIKPCLDAIRRDKKVVDGRLHYVLPTEIGNVTVVDDVNEKELSRAMKQLGMRS